LEEPDEKEVVFVIWPAVETSSNAQHFLNKRENTSTLSDADKRLHLNCTLTSNEFVQGDSDGDSDSNGLSYLQQKGRVANQRFSIICFLSFPSLEMQSKAFAQQGQLFVSKFHRCSQTNANIFLFQVA
jgi:hypothetical protein